MDYKVRNENIIIKGSRGHYECVYIPDEDEPITSIISCVYMYYTKRETLKLFKERVKKEMKKSFINLFY